MFVDDNILIKSLRKEGKRRMAGFKAFRQLAERISRPEYTVGTLNYSLK